MIRVSVAARSASVRAALQHVVQSIPSLAFGEAVDLTPFSLAEVSGDVLLIQTEDSDEHDWSAWADLPIPVLLFVHSPDSALLHSMLRSGIRGVILPDATHEEIESAVNAVHAGLVVTSPALLSRVLPEAPITEELADPLSDRELEVLDLMAEGLSNKLIAYRLNISEHTVKTHVASVFGKLGASSRTEAVSQAIRRGLIML